MHIRFYFQKYLGLILVFFYTVACGQITEDELLIQRLMLTKPEKFRPYLLEPEKYEIQIIYTQIKRDSLNRPQLKEFTYAPNPQKYFNPASLAKLPLVLLSLEKLHEINQPNIHKYTRIGYGADTPCQLPLVGNNLKEKEYPCLGRFIEKILLVSDNDSYTRLYEFLGQRYIQAKMNEKCYEGVRIIRRFNECDTLQNRYTNPIHFYNESGQVIYSQKPVFNPTPYYPHKSTWQRTRPINNIPILNPDFENYLPLKAAHQMLMAIMLPEALPEHQRFNLQTDDYQLLRRSLGAYPREGKLSTYLEKDGYFDTYKKYLYFGRADASLVNLRSFNVVGWWAGYVSDVAYFVDYQRGIEFFLSAVISTNQVPINEGEGYQKVSFPFMRDLGKLIYEYETQKQGKRKANIDYLKFY